MARKMVDFRTITLPMKSDTQEMWHQKVMEYLNNGWEVFNTHFLGIVGPEISFAYDFARYEEVPEATSAVDFALTGDAPKRRGRPPKAKVEEVAETLIEGAGAIPS